MKQFSLLKGHIINTSSVTEVSNTWHCLPPNPTLLRGATLARHTSINHLPALVVLLWFKPTIHCPQHLPLVWWNIANISVTILKAPIGWGTNTLKPNIIETAHIYIVYTALTLSNNPLCRNPYVSINTLNTIKKFPISHKWWSSREMPPRLGNFTLGNLNPN